MTAGPPSCTSTLISDGWEGAGLGCSARFVQLVAPASNTMNREMDDRERLSLAAIFFMGFLLKPHSIAKGNTIFRTISEDPLAKGVHFNSMTLGLDPVNLETCSYRISASECSSAPRFGVGIA